MTNIFSILKKPEADHGDSLYTNAADRKLTVKHTTQGLKKLHYEIDGTPVTAFLKYTNYEILNQYYRNPENTMPGDSIEKNFWKSKNVEKIPYHRGFIYAFYLDNQIRLATNSEKNIRDFFLLLYKQNLKNKQKELSVEDFIETLSAFLPKDQITSEIKTYMYDGKLLDFRKVRLIDGFRVKYEGEVPQVSASGSVDIGQLYR